MTQIGAIEVRCNISLVGCAREVRYSGNPTTQCLTVTRKWIFSKFTIKKSILATCLLACCRKIQDSRRALFPNHAFANDNDNDDDDKEEVSMIAIQKIIK